MRKVKKKDKTRRRTTKRRRRREKKKKWKINVMMKCEIHDKNLFH